MERERRKDAPLTRRPKDVTLYETPLGSPSYSPPPHEESLKEEMEEDVEGEDDQDEEEDRDTDKEARAAHRKAKGKAKASPSPSPEEEEEDDDDDDEEDDDDDNDDDDSNKENDQPSESPHSAKSNSITSSPAADEDTQMDMDMNNYWAHEARKALEIAARKEALGYGSTTQFGDADAVMNETLSTPSSPSSSSNNNKENQRKKKPSPLVPKNSPERHEAGWPGDGGRGHGRGRGRGRGTGWGLAWQETMAEQKMDPDERDHWGIYDDPPPSPEGKDHWGIYDDSPPSPSEEEQERHVLEETAWEEYDYEAWERAAQEAAEKERRKVPTWKEPDTTTFPTTPARVHDIGEGSSKSSKGEDFMRQSGQLVRAVRDYKAILPGTYLSYQKDDVMRVLHWDSDGKI